MLFRMPGFPVLAAAFSVVFFLGALTPLVPAPSVAPQQTSYNENEARMLLVLAAAAYGNASMTDSAALACIQNNFGNSASSFQLVNSSTVHCDLLGNTCAAFALINVAEQRIYIVFRGTKTWSQLAIEGWDSLQPGVNFYGVGKANEYFSNGMEKLWPTVSPILSDPNYQNFPVTFTGHSLGAAMSSLAALKTAVTNLRQGRQIRLVNFGQPRVGNIDLANVHNQLIPQSYRVVHSIDIVPHLPECGKLHNMTNANGSRPCNSTNTKLSYHHGIEIWYPTHMYSSSQFIECLGWPFGEDFSCSDSLTFDALKYELYFYAHRHYFEIEVPIFGETSCSGQQKNNNGNMEDAVETQYDNSGEY